MADAPKLLTTKLPTEIDTTYTFSTSNFVDLPAPLDFFKARLESVDNSNIGSAQLSLVATVKVPLPAVQPPQQPPPPTYSIVGTLTSFALDFGLIALLFTSLTFTQKSNEKLKVEAKTAGVFFGDFLSFVNNLESLLKSFEDPPSPGQPSDTPDPGPGPYFHVSVDHVEAGYTLTIPDIGVGAFSLSNISLGAKLTIPFFGQPVRMAFYFATREHPFVITVYIFGGGSFLQLALEPQGVETIEASLEFGCACAFSVAVAKGNVHIMAGIYMKWEVSANTGSLTGFLDIGGALSVLGLVNLSVHIYLGLTYDLGSGTVWGEASVKVEVQVALFSKSVTLGPVRKEFGGSGSARAIFADEQAGGGRLGNPGVAIKDVITQPDWQAYCQAFAP